MATKTKSSPVLPGLSRSVECRTKSCGRLAGHKGAHRASLHQAQQPKAAKPTGAAKVTVGTIIVLADGTKCRVVEVERPEPKARTSRPARRTRRPAAPKGQCRVVKAGTRCGRAYGHKQAGTRHSFAVVRQLPESGPKGRDVQIVKGKSSRRSNYVASSKPSSRLA